MIANGGDIVTQAEIAKQLGVSRAAVSLVLSGKAARGNRVAPALRTKIERIAADLGYVPNVAAQQLNGKRSRIFGVIANDWFHSVQLWFLASLHQAAETHQYKILTTQMGDRAEAMAEFIAEFASRGTDGLLYYAMGSHRLWPDVERHLSTHRNVVWVLGRPPLGVGRVVDCDVAAGTRSAVQHLLDRGRKRLALVIGDPDQPVEAARRKGFVQAMSDAGMPSPEASVLYNDVFSVVFTPEDSLKPAGAIADELLARKMDAVLMPTDLIAGQLIRQLRRRGIQVPQDMAVVGHNKGVPSQVCDPPMTTISFELPDLASHAVKLLIAGADGDTSPAQVLLPARLVVREST